MKHKYKDIEGSRREFIVEIPSEEVKLRLDRVYEEIKETAQLPGFRKGKVPRELLEKYHGKAAREKVLGDLVSDSYRKVLKESNTIPVGMPQISQMNFKEGKDVSYKATVDIRPRMALKNYRNIKVKKKKIEVRDEDVKGYLSTLQESYAQFKSIEGRGAKLGDHLICDVSCQVDGKPMGEEQKNIWLVLDKKHTLPELVDGLIGAQKKDAKEIEATLPENNKEPKYSKKRALFRVKINQIKEKELPEINDEFVKGLGPYQNVAQLKEAVEKDLIRKQENRVKADMGNQVLEELLRNSQLTPPKGLVDEETERLIKEAKEQLQKRNVKPEDIEKRVPELRKELKEKAVKNVRLFFILDEIARIENIDVTDQEIDETFKLLAQQSNASEQDLKKYYKDNNFRIHLKNQLKEQKIIDFLLKNAEIKEAKQ